MTARNLMAGVGAAVVLVLAGSAASAATLITVPLGALTTSGLSSQQTTPKANQDYDFTFSVAHGLEITGQGNSTSTLVSSNKYFTSGTIQFFDNLGTATNVILGSAVGGAGNFTVLSGGGFHLSTGSTGTENLAPGNYVLVVDPVGPAGTTFTSSISAAAVPEPATWALTIMGLLGLGVVLRRQRKTATGMSLA